MVKLGMCAEKKWRRSRGLGWLATVLAETEFRDGMEVVAINHVSRWFNRRNTKFVNSSNAVSIQML